MVTCPACREELPDGARFCGVCGFRLAPMIPKRNIAEARLAGESPILWTRRERQRIASEELAPTSPRHPPPTPAEPPASRDDAPGRRSSARYPMRVDVSCSNEHHLIASGRAENISTGGLFVVTETPAAVGERVTIRFSLPGLEQQSIARCEVVWCRLPDAAADAAPGMGLRFVDLDAEVAAAIALFVEHREPVAHE